MTVVTGLGGWRAGGRERPEPRKPRLHRALIATAGPGESQCQDTTQWRDIKQSGDMAAVRKRKYPDTEEEEMEKHTHGKEEVTDKKRRRVMFENVTVFHFSRRQGHTCVPSQVRGRRITEVTQALSGFEQFEFLKKDMYVASELVRPLTECMF